MLLYVPVNKLITGGTNLESPIDKFIPLVHIFVIPYLSGIIFWILTIIYINFRKNQTDSVRFNKMVITASIISVVIYILLPTFVNRPQISGTDIFSQILNLVYANDRVYNAAPSGHTFYTIICLVTLWKVAPKHRIAWIVISVLIAASTLFTKQHNIADVLLGVIFAVIINFKYTNKSNARNTRVEKSIKELNIHNSKESGLEFQNRVRE
jgi:membrane-associated phospholipid phosphatase